MPVNGVGFAAGGGATGFGAGGAGGGVLPQATKVRMRAARRISSRKLLRLPAAVVKYVVKNAIPILLVAGLVGTVAIARAACDPHPMEHFDLQPERSTTPLLGSDPCELRADSATTATLRCAERTVHLTWVAP
jgi:hypothetical protein